jgi:hypothetical protein
MPDRSAEAQVLWDQLHQLAPGAEDELLAALFQARPELLREALGRAVEAEGVTNIGPVVRATRMATAWDLYGEQWFRFDLLRSIILGEVQATDSGYCASVSPNPLSPHMDDLGTRSTLKEALALVDEALTSGELNNRWHLR